MKQRQCTLDEELAEKLKVSESRRNTIMKIAIVNRLSEFNSRE